MTNSKYLVSILLFIPLLVLGCSHPSKIPELKELTRSTAEHKLIKICKDDYKLNIITQSFKNTLWVYLPTEESFIELKASKEGPKLVTEGKEKFTVNFLDGQFENNAFSLQYDITLSKSYNKSFGYTSSTTQKYQSDQRNILTAIFRTYGSIGEKKEPDTYKKEVFKKMTEHNPSTKTKEQGAAASPFSKKTHKAPDFVVIVLSDIKLGLETKMFIHFEDLKRAMHDFSFQEEYAKRAVIDQPIGQANIIGDKDGHHLNMRDLTWGEFLVKQMVYRINFKYSRSAFPPLENTNQQILMLAVETLSAYAFKNFTHLHMINMHNEEEQTISKENLFKIVPEKKKPSQGKLHTIHFF